MPCFDRSGRRDAGRQIAGRIRGAPAIARTPRSEVAYAYGGEGGLFDGQVNLQFLDSPALGKGLHQLAQLWVHMK
jgi:hypothetical protein